MMAWIMDRHGRLVPGEPYCFPDPPSVRIGESFTLHYGGRSERDCFAFVYERTGSLIRAPIRVEPNARPGTPETPWSWPGISVQAEDAFGKNTSPGVYLLGVAPRPPRFSDASRSGLLVLRRRAGAPPRPIMYKIPLFTYHAYNRAGGSSFYFPGDNNNPVTWLRPGGGAGGYTEGKEDGVEDTYAPESMRQIYAHWDEPMINWLFQNFDPNTIDFCTDLDLHRDPQLLAGCSLLISAGHDEYWSPEMRHNLDEFIKGGGNVAFFSGNTCWWQIAVDLSKNIFNRLDQWPNHSEQALTGVTFASGGARWSAGPRPVVPYTVQAPAHPVFDGLGLKKYDTIGSERYPVIGHEFDGAPYNLDPYDEKHLITKPNPATADRRFNILAYGIAPINLCEGARTSSCWNRLYGQGTATLGCYTYRDNEGWVRGTVFNAATTDWPLMLADPKIHRITLNVINGLKNGPVPPTSSWLASTNDGASR